jgi:DNA-binding Xre family transcriptional regulator
MVFKLIHWQNRVQGVMRRKLLSYRTLAKQLRMKHATLYRYVNHPVQQFSIDNYLLICRHLEIEPLEFFEYGETQLKLL